MADSKISALTAVTTPAGAQEIPVNDAGTNKKLTVAQVNAYCEPLVVASTASQGPGFAADTYVTGSGISVPVTRIQAQTLYRCTIQVSKTAAGTATPAFTLRFGTAGTTADASIGSYTSTAQTAAVDDGMIEVWGLFNSVGSGTSAVVRSSFRLSHLNASTGFAGRAITFGTALSAGFNSTTSGSIMGVSLNGGTSAAWTVNMVAAELINLL